MRSKRTKLINALKVLNGKDLIEYSGNIDELLKDRLPVCSNEIEYSYETLDKYFPLLCRYNAEDSVIWQYICIHIFALQSLKRTFKQSCSDDVLSVQDNVKLKTIMDRFTGVGLSVNLAKKIPTSRTFNGSVTLSNCDIEIARYNRLLVVVVNLLDIAECEQLRNSVFTHLLRILASFYQLLHCPLKKPTPKVSYSTIEKFVMTEENYNRLMEDRCMLAVEYQKLKKMVHISYFVIETMKLFKDDVPIWMKKALAHELDSIILDRKGVFSISQVLLQMHSDYDVYDRTKTWKTLNIIIKIIFKFYGTKEFTNNIVPQILQLNKDSRNQKINSSFENIYILCTKFAYDKNKSLCEKVFLADLIQLMKMFGDDKFDDNEEVSTQLHQIVRLCYCLFVLEDSDLTTDLLPFSLIEDQMHLLMHIYLHIKNITNKDNIKLKNDFKDILLKYLTHKNKLNETLDIVLLQINCKQQPIKFSLTSKDSSIVYNKNDSIHVSNLTVNSDTIFELFKDDNMLLVKLFMYLLNCLTESNKYFTSNDNRSDLLEDFYLDINLERKIVVFNLLSKISENKEIQKSILGDPREIIEYFKVFLVKNVTNKVHSSKNTDSEEFSSLFTVVMIIQSLMQECENKDIKKYEVLLPVMQKISMETSSMELLKLGDAIIRVLVNKSNEPSKKKSKVDEAIELICDAEIPVRGHGLLCLSKLLENKDPEALERKQYILNILQNNLKNEDSYIYLNAIKGLAALADIFPETVVTILCEEYSDYQRNDVELRMKLGEVLVQVTKRLGDSTQKHKAILLNTFLAGTKDYDHLVRASSLSNLGEVCKILGYKLGTIVKEVLECVHSIVSTDKAIEPRRAAVAVLRLLLAGLETRMITFLKADILPIYRTLKNIYTGNEDEIMCLQAQLAIEELNANMEKIFKTLPNLNFGKKQLHMK